MEDVGIEECRECVSAEGQLHNSPPARGLGSTVRSPVGSGVQLRPKSNLVNFRLKI